jgi:hypothetical protein
MTTMAAAAAVSTPAVVAMRRRAVSAWRAAMGRREPAAETFRSSTSAMEGTAKFRSWNIAGARAAGRGQSAAARSDRVPATRGIGRNLRRGRLASASATALCWAIRHPTGFAGWLVVLRMTRPPRQLARYAPALYAHRATPGQPRPRPATPAEARRTSGSAAAPAIRAGDELEGVAVGIVPVKAAATVVRVPRRPAPAARRSGAPCGRCAQDP